MRLATDLDSRVSMPESQVTKSMERYAQATARDKNPAVALSGAMRAQDGLEPSKDVLLI
jgi:hypothetical protein